jgi:type VI secretion system secreted protein VgrG
MALDQATRFLSLKVDGLTENDLLLTSFSGQEEMSRLFSFRLVMISDNNDIKANQVVGKNVTFSVQREDDSRRYFNGFISRFSAGDEDENGRRNYNAEVVPWLWFLTQTADCRIFQNKTIPDIIQQIFQDLGFSDFETEIKGDHKEWEYCVQYRETDFNFVSRLMEQEGIFYFFKHEDGVHKLVLADQSAACKDCPEAEVDYPRDVGSRAIDDYITTWEHRYEFHSGKWAHTDYNFKTPSTSLMAQTNTKTNLANIKKYEIYDYPGEYPDKGVGDKEVRLRIEEEEVAHDVVEASSLCKTFTAGGKFKIKEHRSPSEEGNKYIITSVRHTASETTPYESGVESAGEAYSNTFTAIPESVAFRPARITPKPLVSGVQTAVVVGPSGEEIYCDEFGRVKVQFHWDREGKKDENSSCWMRVSQSIAGKSWGFIMLPRIGQEVIVDFLEGDPDRPLIIGGVYNAEQMPPFGLPGSKNISGMKSDSTKGGGGYNEYIMDDTKGNELIREHGQFDKDSTIEHDLREHVLNDRSRDVTNNETILVGVNRLKSVGNNETLNVGANRSRTVGKNETVTVTLTRTHTVGINEAITIGAAQEVTVGAMRALTVGASQTTSIGANMSESIGSNRTENVGANRSSNVAEDDSLNVGKKLTVVAGDEISLTTGKASIVMKKDGTITISGKDITVTGKGKITAKASKDMTLKGKKILQN